MGATERPRGSEKLGAQRRGADGVERKRNCEGGVDGSDGADGRDVRSALAVADAEIRAQYLTQEMLSFDEVDEEGGEIMDGKGKLMKLGSLENREFLVRLSDELITPNPNQPRKYFDAAKLAELKGTIESQGQKSAIVVVPYFDGDNIKLFVIDGERRLRVLKTAGKEFIRVVIRWAATEEEIFEQSLILNESKADHNPIERAEAYERLVGFQEKKGVPNPIQVVAKRLGIPDWKISNHLKLLDLPGPIKEMVIRGDLVLKNSLLVRQAIKKYGTGLPVDQLVEALRVVSGGDDPRAAKALGGRGGMTREQVTRAVRGVLAEGGHVDQASELGAKKGVYDFTFGLGRAKAGVDRLRAADPDKVVDVLRTRKGEPPELLRDRLVEVIAGLQELQRSLVERAIRADPLEKVPGKSAFLKFMQGKRKSFGNEIRFNIACLLAKASDEGEGEVMMVSEITKRLGVSVNDFASNQTRLILDLKGLGITLDQQVVREKVQRTMKGKPGMYYEPRPAYRLKWQVKGQNDEAAAEDDEEPRPPATGAVSQGLSMRLEQQPRAGTARKISGPKTDKAGGDDEEAEDVEVPRRGGIPEDLFDEGDAEGDREVDEDAVAAEVELRGARRAGSGGGSDRGIPPPGPSRIAELKAAHARAQARMAGRAPAAGRSSAPVRASVPPPDIKNAHHPVSAPEHLKTVAQQIAQQVAETGSSLAIRHSAQFGARLGVKIEERVRPGISVYIIYCNQRAFTTNFGAYRSSFAEWIAKAVGKRPHEVEVHLRDID